MRTRIRGQSGQASRCQAFHTLPNDGVFQAIDGPGVAVGAFEGGKLEGAFDFERAGGEDGGVVGTDMDVGQVVGLTAGAEFALRVFQQDEFFDAALCFWGCM